MAEFIYEKATAPCGVAVEMIYGADDKSAKVWKLFAMQIFSEAEGDYRVIEHMDNGAPLLAGIPQRISISHTTHCLVITSLPKTPDIDLTEVNVRTAMGVDLEKADRGQVIKIKEKFLCDEELSLLPSVEDASKASAEDIKKYILAWTCKEALYKADFGKATDWKTDYSILSLPKIAPGIKDATPEKYGEGEILIGNEKIRMNLSSWEMEGHVVTIAFSGKIARYQV